MAVAVRAVDDNVWNSFRLTSITPLATAVSTSATVMPVLVVAHDAVDANW